MKSYTVIYRTTYYPQNNASDIESFILQHIRDRIKITDLPKYNYRNIFLLSYRIWKLELDPTPYREEKGLESPVPAYAIVIKFKYIPIKYMSQVEKAVDILLYKVYRYDVDNNITRFYLKLLDKVREEFGFYNKTVIGSFHVGEDTFGNYMIHDLRKMFTMIDFLNRKKNEPKLLYNSYYQETK